MLDERTREVASVQAALDKSEQREAARAEALEEAQAQLAAVREEHKAVAEEAKTLRGQSGMQDGEARTLEKQLTEQRQLAEARLAAVQAAEKKLAAQRKQLVKRLLRTMLLGELRRAWVRGLHMSALPALVPSCLAERPFPLPRSTAASTWRCCLKVKNRTSGSVGRGEGLEGAGRGVARCRASDSRGPH